MSQSQPNRQWEQSNGAHSESDEAAESTLRRRLNNRKAPADLGIPKSQKCNCGSCPVVKKRLLYRGPGIEGIERYGRVRPIYIGY